MSKSKAKPKAKGKRKVKAAPQVDVQGLDKKTQKFVVGLLAEVARLKKQSEDAAQEKKRRADWKMHDEVLELECAKLMMSKSEPPSYAAIAKAVGCDVNTIKRHLKERSFEERFAIWRLATPFVVQNVFQQATNGKNPEFAKMWLEKIEGLNKKGVDITSNGDSILPITKIEIVRRNVNAKGEQST